MQPTALEHPISHIYYLEHPISHIYYPGTPNISHILVTALEQI